MSNITKSKSITFAFYPMRDLNFNIPTKFSCFKYGATFKDFIVIKKSCSVRIS